MSKIKQMNIEGVHNEIYSHGSVWVHPVTCVMYILIWISFDFP